jgi:tRNA A-37 threonylcarbamoyl transferase component Bud32
MTPERWNQITRIFHSARARDAISRHDYLQEACKGDPSLRDEVEALLAGDAAAGSFGEEPAFMLRREARPLTPGTDVGAYRIEAMIGAGGMGVVYRARDEKLRRTVAVKVLPEGALAGDEQRLRFVREARAASALNHPNIVAIYDIDRASGRDFIAMEFVRGVPLHQLVPQQGLPVDRAMEIAVQIARAMAAAHESGLLHRDLKPANILVTSDWHVKVIDFGLAKLAEPGNQGDEKATALPGTQPGAIVGGTPGYAAPEQVEGRAVDARADVFAIGAVLYEMLAGRRAFQKGSTAATLASVLHDPPPPLATVRNGVSRDLERVVSRCLEKDPRARYPSAGELLKDLLDVQTRLAARGVRLGLVLRRPAIAAALVTVTVAAVMAGIWIWRSQARVRWARMVAIPEAQRLSGEGRNFAAYRGLREAERFIPDDPVLRELLAETTTRVSIRTTPEGGVVQIRDLLEPENWDTLGRAPLEGVRIPADDAFVCRVTLDGHQPLEQLRWYPGGNVEPGRMDFALHPAADAPPDMVSRRRRPTRTSARRLWTWSPSGSIGTRSRTVSSRRSSTPAAISTGSTGRSRLSRMASS